MNRLTEITVTNFLLILIVATSGCVGTQTVESPTRGYVPAKAPYGHLAPTPPMGWNSWNFFAQDINEKRIKAIADAMVSSGMRDAGYTYLVLDDAWMAAERDANGALQADSDKFPKGMKEIGDYLHSKGLKFGIYQDRAHLTCQGLPGSFGHERIDMETFASWGVDYVKMDSCFGRYNGRLSSEDYMIFRMFLEQTGRPVVLSISDFGNAAWVWGGKESSQLWRTGWDIRSNMESIYECAEASAGSERSHPAFNGLWQFAGPGYWNDPDMLQVGNFKISEEQLSQLQDTGRSGIGKFKIEDDQLRASANKAHFGLWCILAAPLMSGNDLRNMSDEVRDVLTAPEVIAVNQDPRGIQGYKVFVDGNLEIYNKPLADGTTAVLLLNKGTEISDLTVTWEMIGLSGRQPVRDLWQRKDLGIFKDSFTAKGLGQHGSELIRIGTKGKPLPTAEPVPLEKYTVTRKGETNLSDLYYAWRRENPPVYNKTFEGNPIRINGKTFEKGFGLKSESIFMFAGTERGDRLVGTFALDEAYTGEGKGQLIIYHEGLFGDRRIWDSYEVSKDTPAKEINVELDRYNCIMFEFVKIGGKDAEDVLGVIGNLRVIDEQ